jgi:hypothetical protein
MRLAEWVRRFERNQENREEPDWDAKVELKGPMLAKVLSSLEQFELGDGGGPASLIAYNARSFSSSSEEMQRVIDLWFSEEKEHSRLLGKAVQRLGGRKLKTHWSFEVFCWVRRVAGVRFELQVLTVTELVSTAYYRVLRRHVPDKAVREVCSLILRDEAGHVSFQRDRLATKFGPGVSAIWKAQFWACGLAAATMLWINHGPCLKCIGGSRREFYGEARFEIARFIRRVSSTVAMRNTREGIHFSSQMPALKVVSQSRA